jgi:hypothetical protein
MNNNYYNGFAFTSGPSFASQFCPPQYNTAPIIPLPAASGGTISFVQYPKEEKEVSAQKSLSSAVNAGVQVIYRYGKGTVQTQILRGVLDTEVAEEMFLEQFGEDDETPEVVASVSVLVAA